MTLFQGKYRIETTRLQNWDYASKGYYFITICTKNRKNLFGEIENEKMILNDFGLLTDKEWQKSFKIRKELKCDKYVIMPNHIHAIVIINPDNPVETHGVRLNVKTHGVRLKNASSQGDACHASLQGGELVRMPKSISSFVAGFKSSVTRKYNEFQHTKDIPVWQTRFYEHIIRNEISYENISNYIEQNPIKWHEDKFNDTGS